VTNASTFIPAIFHYCDRWCERCPFHEHCERRREQLALEDLLRRDDPQLVAWLTEADWTEGFKDDHPSWMSASEQRAFDDVLERRDPPLTDEEFDRLQTFVDEKARRVIGHPLARAGAAYERAVTDEIQQLYDQIYPTGEWQSDRALEAIARYAARIRATAARAAGGLVGGLFGDERDEDPKGIQSDANGNAKLLRLLLAESRDSWQLLAGHEQVAELEGHMLWHIYGIDDLVKEHFPRAGDFVRPGFDDEQR
jgi:succinate dehydrogenase flavin-adding protein (antitoxin of CptAB toxin-antitoxin module)